MTSPIEQNRTYQMALRILAPTLQDDPELPTRGGSLLIARHFDLPKLQNGSIPPLFSKQLSQLLPTDEKLTPHWEIVFALLLGSAMPNFEEQSVPSSEYLVNLKMLAAELRQVESRPWSNPEALVRVDLPALLYYLPSLRYVQIAALERTVRSWQGLGRALSAQVEDFDITSLAQRSWDSPYWFSIQLAAFAPELVDILDSATQFAAAWAFLRFPHLFQQTSRPVKGDLRSLTPPAWCNFRCKQHHIVSDYFSIDNQPIPRIAHHILFHSAACQILNNVAHNPISISPYELWYARR